MAFVRNGAQTNVSLYDVSLCDVQTTTIMYITCGIAIRYSYNHTLNFESLNEGVIVFTAMSYVLMLSCQLGQSFVQVESNAYLFFSSIEFNLFGIVTGMVLNPCIAVT